MSVPPAPWPGAPRQWTADPVRPPSGGAVLVAVLVPVLLVAAVLQPAVATVAGLAAAGLAVVQRGRRT